MKKVLTMAFALAALTGTDTSAAELKGLHKSVKIKVERYCPQKLSRDQFETLKTKKEIEVDGIPYIAEKQRIGEISGENTVLCSGRYSQNRSAPGHVVCIHCNEDDASSKKGIIAISTHVTKDIEKTLAEREESAANLQMASHS